MKIIQPKRRKHSCVQIWKGTRDTVFPLLCPVRERDWTPDWDPKLVVSQSGVMEQECLFVETDTPNDAIWIVTKYDPVNFEVVMYRIVPEIIVGKFAITLDREVEKTTSASVFYEQTALSTDGEKIVNNFTTEAFEKFMEEFKTAIDHYLTTGKMINSNELMTEEAAIHHH